MDELPPQESNLGPEDFENIDVSYDMYFELSFNINKILNQIVSQINFEAPYFFDKEDPLAPLKYMRDGLFLLKEVIKKFHNPYELIDSVESYISRGTIDKELINLSRILKNLFGIKYINNTNNIPKITKEDIKKYCIKLKSIGIDEIIKEINDTINSISVFINGNISEYFNNPHKMKDILVRWIFFSNFLLDYKYYMEESLFFDKIPCYIFYEMTSNNNINIRDNIDTEKIKSFKPIIEQLIKFQFKYFPYLSKIFIHLNETRRKIHDKLKFLICSYIIYFLLLQAIENKNKDFIVFYYSILYYYYNNKKFYEYVQELLQPIFSAFKNEDPKIPKMPDFSKIDISDEDFLFSLASIFFEEVKYQILTSLDVFEKCTGKELSEDERKEFRILYVENLIENPDIHPVLYLISKTISNEKLREKVIRFLAGIEHVFEKIEVPLVPIEKEIVKL